MVDDRRKTLTIAEGVRQSISDVLCKRWEISRHVNVELLRFAGHVHQLVYVHFVSDTDLVQCVQWITKIYFVKKLLIYSNERNQDIVAHSHHDPAVKKSEEIGFPVDYSK